MVVPAHQLVTVQVFECIATEESCKGAPLLWPLVPSPCKAGLALLSLASCDLTCGSCRAVVLETGPGERAIPSSKAQHGRCLRGLGYCTWHAQEHALPSIFIVCSPTC